jgi:hypothetical protein
MKRLKKQQELEPYDRQECRDRMSPMTVLISPGFRGFGTVQILLLGPELLAPLVPVLDFLIQREAPRLLVDPRRRPSLHLDAIKGLRLHGQ